MTRNEFSDMFTTLLNSYDTQAQFGEQASRQEIALDEYEKSVLLTQAQDIVVKSYFDRTLNSQGQGFDDTPRRQVDFSSLIKVKELESLNDNSSAFDKRGILYKMPDAEDGRNTTDVLFILNEKMVVGDKSYVIVPISYREYDREMSKPFAQPLKKQAWRLFQNDSTGFDVLTELIPKETLNITSAIYKIRYVRRPVPIILEDMPDGLSIDGVSEASGCELNPILHMDILNKAVELAIVTRGYNSQRVREANERA